MTERMTRRELLRMGGLGSVVAFLAACAPKVVEKIVEKEVTKIVKEVVQETVIVEGTPQVVEREVTKIVKETVVVEAPPAEKVEEKIEIVGWGTRGFNPDVETEKPYADAVNAHLRAKYPNVSLKYMDMGWDEVLRQNLVTALLGGTGPDMIVGENFIQPYAEIGAFLPVDDIIEDVKDNLVEGCYAASVVGGKAYGICQYTACFGFERNPNVIEKAGLDPENPPKFWSELLEQCAAITKAGNGEYYGYTLQGPVGFLIGGILRFAIYHKTAQADLCKDNCTHPWYDNPKSEKVLAFLRELHQYTPPGLSFNPDEGQVYTQLFQGVSAYQPCGAWHLQWAKDSGLDNARYSTLPIPDEDGVEATGIVGNVILSAMSGTKYPAETLYFMRCCLEDDVVEHNWDVFSRFPPTRSGLNTMRPKSDEAQQMFIDLLLNADLGVLPQWRIEPNKLWTAYNDMITKLLTTEDPILDLMAEAQETADRVMQEG